MIIHYHLQFKQITWLMLKLQHQSIFTALDGDMTAGAFMAQVFSNSKF